MTVVAPERQTEKNVLFCSDGHYAGLPTPRMRRFEKSANRPALIVNGLPIFRSGTFRDSMGWEHTYASEHMQMMQSNFEILKSRGTFVDVPVRKNHPSPFTNTMDEVIGYVVGLSVQNFTSPVDGQVYAYLMADVEILDAVAIEKVESGLWRNRSSEVGSYVTNDESEFWPALLGFAYVDIPAVEGLNFSKINGAGTDFAAIIDKEGSAVGADNTNQVPAAPAAPTAPTSTPHSFALSNGVTTDFARVQAHITELETSNAQFSSMFSELQTAARKNFVSQLAKDNKILQTQVDSLTEVALLQTDEGWEKFKAAYEAAPVNPTLAQHAAASQAPAVDAAQAQLATDKSIYNRLKAGGTMTPDQIKDSAVAKRLVAAGVDLSTL